MTYLLMKILSDVAGKHRNHFKENVWNKWL